ncbi:MAG: hypothetical protein RL322_2238 [Pseudomonadota bacterium]|jgi:pimeloyl-ACP methyl ester carboxylesterase
MIAADRLRRGYIKVEGRHVHYRAAGTGDPVILIHQSPTSARTLDAQTLGFAQAGFQAIALDIPGLGRSDPLGLPQPEIGDQALALGRALEVLRLPRVALYGSHTGALICCDFARRAPERVSCVLIDGYPIYTQGESERRVATYFPPFDLRWDGGHLLWLWSRLREQYLFWPWNVPGESTSARCDIPDAATLTDGVVDMLRVGNGYRLPYAAAFRCAAAQLIADIRVPTYHLAAPDDSLTQALGLLEGMSDANQVVPVSAELNARVADEVALLNRHRAGTVQADFGRVRCPPSAEARIDRDYVETASGQLGLRSAGQAASGRPLLILPPTPGSARQLEAEIIAFGRRRPVVALDVPGCGDSGEGFEPEQIASMAGLTEALVAAARHLGLSDYDVYGLGGGANLALHLAQADPGVRRVAIQSPVVLPSADPERLQRHAPVVDARPDGTHLLAFWHQQRNRHLFRPWFDERLAARRNNVPGLAVDRLNDEVLAMLESWRTWHQVWRTILSDQPEAALASAGSRLRRFEWHRDEWAGCGPRSAETIDLGEALWDRVERIARALAD